MKSRSSTGVGQKIDLEYNIETMRITDPGDEGQESFRKPQGNIMDSIKARSQVKEADEEVDTPKLSADVQSNKLKQLLGQIKST
jgi:hypothetical protein